MNTNYVMIAKKVLENPVKICSSMWKTIHLQILPVALKNKEGRGKREEKAEREGKTPNIYS